MNKLTLTVPPELSGQRLDKIISSLSQEVSRSLAVKLIDEGEVTLNGKAVQKSTKALTDDKICFVLPTPQVLEAVPQNIPVEIVYEDSHLLVVNKPKGMVVHPAPGNPDGTLVNALMYHCKGRLSTINGVIRPGIVHRIDKDTSGLLIVAKTDTAHNHLAAQIKEHSFRREYRAVVTGRMPRQEGTIDLPLGRSRSDRKKQTVNGINPRNAVTHYRVLESYPGYDYCKFILETGRTHQIRVHCAHIGHPVAGDSVYGSEKNSLGLEGQCLHAAVIGFIHPITEEYMEFSAPLPDYFINVLNKINK